MKPTLIVARRTPEEASATSAGVVLVTPFAPFKELMAMFSEERAPSHPLGRWDLVVMVETQGSRERAVLHASCEEESEA